MRFRFFISKIGNHFFFVQNFAQWHHSCRIGENKLWIRRTGPLTGAERKSLQRIVPVLNRYATTRHPRYYKTQFYNLFEPFFTKPEDQIWPFLGQKIGASNQVIVQQALASFSGRFEKIWADEYPKLRLKRTFLQENLNSLDYESIAIQLNTFFRPANRPRTIAVYLLVHANPNDLSGGANIGGSRITLEVSNTKHEKWMIDLLLHETAHLFQQDFFENLLSRHLSRWVKPNLWPSDSPGPRVIIREAITHSLFGGAGYYTQEILKMTDASEYLKYRLGGGYAKIKNNPADFSRWTDYASGRIYNLTKDYIKSSRTIDIAYLDKLSAVWDEYKKIIS